jgi:hypothetical protein
MKYCQVCNVVCCVAYLKRISFLICVWRLKCLGKASFSPFGWLIYLIEVAMVCTPVKAWGRVGGLAGCPTFWLIVGFQSRGLPLQTINNLQVYEVNGGALN